MRSSKEMMVCQRNTKRTWIMTNCLRSNPTFDVVSRCEPFNKYLNAVYIGFLI